MNYKKSKSAYQQNHSKEIDIAEDYPTYAELMRKKSISINEPNTVHHRRDLDSLG